LWGGCGQEVGSAVLSSAKIGTSSWRYYVDQAPCRASDYYLGHDQELGRWEGRGLERLGLGRGAAVSEQQLEAMFGRALNPTTGERLGRAWRSDGVTGFDLTFSSPKSVSALSVRALAADIASGKRMRPAASQGVAGREQVASATPAPLPGTLQRDGARQLELFTQPVVWSPAAAGGAAELVASAHDTATRTALAYLDTHAGLSRRGTDGTDQIGTAGFAVALFTHHTSREGDPQLHTHALLLNKVQCQDGTWRTLDGHELYAHKKSAGMIYQTVLRNELTRNLGVAWGPVSRDGQAEILGIPEKLLDTWSKRTHHVNNDATKTIAEYEKTLGRSLTSSEKATVTKIAVLKTRPHKHHEAPESLSARWVAEAAGVGVDLERLLGDAQQAAAHAPTAAPVTTNEVARQALLAAGRTRAVFSRAEVAGQVAALLPTPGLPAAELLAEVEQVTDRALQLADAVAVGAPVHGITPRASDARYATVEILTAEERILTLARTGQRSGPGKVNPAQLRDLLAAVPTRLDRSQLEALLHLITHGDALDVLTAPAGAGKTATLGACTAVWQQAGYRVIGLAPSARAAAELQQALRAANTRGSSNPEVGSGSRADTLAKWLHTRALQPDLDTLSPTVAAVGRNGWARLDERTVLIVDESSMASTLDLDTLIQAARTAGSKVVLVGDPGQIGVINGPGGMLAALVRDGHAVALTGIHRFSHDWEKHASLLLRDGDPDALGTYQEQGRLHPWPDGDTAADQLFTHWQQAVAEGQDALMLARTRVDVDALNARARNAAQAAGHVGGPAVQIGGREWQPGDLLRTRRNQRQLVVGDGHVRNGDRYRVLGRSPDGGLVVEDLSGQGRTTLPAEYVAKHAEYGWAATIDGSQGATADVGLVLVRPGLDREHLYVGMTRGRLGNHAYLTPDPTCGADHDVRLPPPRPRDGQDALERACLDVLRTALAVSGAQDSAHIALKQARAAAAAHVARQVPSTAPATGDQARRPAPDPARERPPLPAAHQQALTDLAARRAEYQQLQQRQRDLRDALRAGERQLAGLSWLAVSRRRTLTTTLAGHEQDLHDTFAPEMQLVAEVDRLATLVRQQEKDRAAQQIPTPRPTPHPFGPTSPRTGPEQATAGRPPRPAVPSRPARPRREPAGSDVRDPYRRDPYGHDYGRDTGPDLSR
jgi:conjugative relaxase-like TrwC/TraI family protein